MNLKITCVLIFYC